MSQTPEEIAAELVKDRLFDEKHGTIGEERDSVNQDAMIFDIAAPSAGPKNVAPPGRLTSSPKPTRPRWLT